MFDRAVHRSILVNRINGSLDLPIIVEKKTNNFNTTIPLFTRPRETDFYTSIPTAQSTARPRLISMWIPFVCV